jgi:hypothetical protein
MPAILKIILDIILVGIIGTGLLPENKTAFC